MPIILKGGIKYEQMSRLSTVAFGGILQPLAMLSLVRRQHSLSVVDKTKMDINKTTHATRIPARESLAW